MKPITNAKEFLKRFDSFKGGEIRSIKILSPTAMLVTLAGQDSARAFDWITIDLEFSGVSDARLLDDTKLSLIDMDDGLSIVYENNKFAFSVGECYNISTTKNSSCYIIGNSLKYSEGAF